MLRVKLALLALIVTVSEGRAAPEDILAQLLQTPLSNHVQSKLEEHCRDCAMVLCSQDNDVRTEILSAVAEKTSDGKINISGKIKAFTCYRSWIVKRPISLRIRGVADLETCIFKVSKKEDFDADDAVVNYFMDAVVGVHDISDENLNDKCDHYFPPQFR